MSTMRGLTSSLWPIRYKPLPDELLSCWLVRLAHGHGLKVQTFCNLIFGNKLQIWNRDIDRTAPAWLLDELSFRTGTSPETTWSTTLRAYEGLLYRKFRLSSTLQWILALQLYHRKPEGYGLQFCPACLREDPVPYFRKRWRVALKTVCTQHRTMLHDRCPKCSAGVAVHRVDMRNPHTLEAAPLSFCHMCGFDLRETPEEDPLFYDSQAAIIQLAANRGIRGPEQCSEWDLGKYCVMRHLCMLMTTRSKHVRIREFVLNQIKCQDIFLVEKHIPFEMRPISERHHLSQLATWLLVDLESRLTTAWRARMIRFNALLKDFSSPPNWYLEIVNSFIN